MYGGKKEWTVGYERIDGPYGRKSVEENLIFLYTDSDQQHISAVVQHG